MRRFDWPVSVTNPPIEFDRWLKHSLFLSFEKSRNGFYSLQSTHTHTIHFHFIYWKNKKKEKNKKITQI